MSSKGSEFTSRPGRNKSREGFVFLLNRLYDISVKCKDTVASVTGWFPSVSATYDTVNNLHYKAHSWKICPTKEPQHQFIKGSMWKCVIFNTNTLQIWHTNCQYTNCRQWNAVLVPLNGHNTHEKTKKHLKTKIHETHFLSLFPKTSI